MSRPLPAGSFSHRHRLSIEIGGKHFYIGLDFMEDNRLPKPTAVGALRSAVAGVIMVRRWLSLFR
jgi:hypothetical protein